MRVLAARASTIYTGRIAAEVKLSDLLILIREPPHGDGSVLVQRPHAGLKPVNWMPAGSHLIRDDPTVMSFQRTQGQITEQLTIYIDQVHYDIQMSDAPMIGDKVLVGDERQCSDFLAANLHLLDFPYPLTLLGREWMTDAGPVDLLCEYDDPDALGRKIALVVECKRVRVSGPDAYQALRYAHAIERAGRWSSVRAVLVAPSLTKPGREHLLNHPEITFCRVKFADLIARDDGL